MHYLKIQPTIPRIGVFDFTGCEGCELQLANKEETLTDFLAAVEVVTFREISSVAGSEYDVALVEGAVTRADEVNRLKKIRQQAKLMVALGTCASFGGVNRLKNMLDLDQANREVYGNFPKDTLPTRAAKEVVTVDLEIPGCPVSKAEVERIVQRLVWGLPFEFPHYPVCVECKQRQVVCMFQAGRLCLGPITRGGCDAACPAGGLPCWGCRGPATDPNYAGFFKLTKDRGFSEAVVGERLDFFGGFEGVR